MVVNRPYSTAESEEQSTEMDKRIVKGTSEKTVFTARVRLFFIFHN